MILTLSGSSRLIFLDATGTVLVRLASHISWRLLFIVCDEDWVTGPVLRWLAALNIFLSFFSRAGRYTDITSLL